MTLKDSIHHYLTMFFVLGQISVSFTTQNRPLAGMQQLKFQIQRIYFWTFYLIVLGASITNIIFFMSIGNTSFEFAAYNITLANRITICCATIASILFYPNELNKLWTRISDLDRFMNDALKCEWQVGQFQYHFNGNAMIYTVFFAFRIFSKYLLRPSAYQFMYAMSIIPTIYSFISQLHIQFYLDLYLNILKSINGKLSKTTYSHTAANKFVASEMALLKEIQTVKMLHLKMWHVCAQFNACFSLILVSIMMQTITNIIPPLYVIVVDFISEGFRNDPRLLSK